MINRFLPPETRYARRMARIARWEKPIVGRRGRLRAWANMLFVDHGVLRLAYQNRHRVGTGGLWRSAQPAPHDLAWFKRRGVRTIISLRGGREHGSWQLQREACEREGLRLVEFVVRSREAPSRQTLLAARDFFAGIDYPAVLHCKSGADRAGFAAALYLILHEDRRWPRPPASSRRASAISASPRPASSTRSSTATGRGRGAGTSLPRLGRRPLRPGGADAGVPGRVLVRPRGRPAAAAG